MKEDIDNLKKEHANEEFTRRGQAEDGGHAQSVAPPDLLPLDSSVNRNNQNEGSDNSSSSSLIRGDSGEFVVGSYSRVVGDDYHDHASDIFDFNRSSNVRDYIHDEIFGSSPSESIGGIENVVDGSLDRVDSDDECNFHRIFRLHSGSNEVEERSARSKMTEENEFEEKISYSPEDIPSLAVTFPHLPSYFNNPCTLKIFEYLSAEELVQISSVSRGFCNTSMTPMLWKELLTRDFRLTPSEVSTLDQEPIIFGSPLSNRLLSRKTENRTSLSASRECYLHRLRGLKSRVAIARDRCEEYGSDLVLDSKKAVMEIIIDMLLLRSFMPLVLASFFASILLVAMWVDGSMKASIYFGLLPLFICIFYVLFCILLNALLYTKREESGTVLGKFWANVRGPIQYMYVEVFEENNISVVVSVVALLLLLAQMVMLGFKLGGESSITFNMEWEMVFIPTWLLFALSLISPCIGCIGMSLFVVLFIFLWIPFFVFFLCLSLKLKGIENHSKFANMRLSLILMPFWILEGAAMLGSLGALIEIIYRLRRDLSGYFALISERLGTVYNL